ncbi:hypothetical protein PBRA_000663 [Plasmodiophora brassicae]|uniref:C2H2-type domain-containing protein n=1 Tax=Plasmodiophora brassicae TaxID=37360 RepID=A0A0G4IPP8_PLABS|nr:hypothetical protein PBRA_000663 [Plasmodiophora brassicae]
MGRKSKPKMKPFCYYCDRVFDDEMVLVTHQKAKHWKCQHCQKKLGSSHSLTVHVFQVHKETLKGVPNAKKGRDDLELAVFGMQNVPEDAIELKRAEQLGQPLPKKPKPDADVPSVAAATTAAAATDQDTAPVVPGTLSGAPTTYYASGAYPSSSSATGYGNAWGSGAGAPSTADTAEEYMIYTDEAVSVEEKRASLPQYRPANAPASIDVDQLQSSIQERLRSLLEGGAPI